MTTVGFYPYSAFCSTSGPQELHLSSWLFYNCISSKQLYHKNELNNKECVSSCIAMKIICNGYAAIFFTVILA